MPLGSSDLSAMRETFAADEIIEQSSPSYSKETKVWSFQKNQNPHLVLRPKSLRSLQKAVEYLCSSKLDFGVRSGGVGSSSGKDVVLSMTAFNDFNFDPDSETVVLGAGQTWGDVDRKMEEISPGHVVVGARCPFIGVGGSVLSGGLSWLSHEFGLSSDPQNLLDAHVVLTNGSCVWASEVPDLLWALRGGGGNFGVVFEFKMKAHRYSSSIFSGMISFPYSSLHALSRGVSGFANSPGDPKMAMHVYVLDAQGAAMKGLPAEAGLSVLIFDANGEEHGRSKAGFKWALDIEGAIDLTKGGLSLRQVNDLQGGTEPMMGMANSNLAAALVEDIDPEFVVRAVRWFEKLVKIDNNLGTASFALIEIMQKGAFDASGAPDATAWPHQARKHVLQLATGNVPGMSPSNEVSLDLLEKAPTEVAQIHDTGDYMPSFIEAYNDLSKIFGANYPRLQALKVKYDPHHRLNKGFLIE